MGIVFTVYFAVGNTKTSTVPVSFRPSPFTLIIVYSDKMGDNHCFAIYFNNSFLLYLLLRSPTEKVFLSLQISIFFNCTFLRFGANNKIYI